MTGACCHYAAGNNGTRLVMAGANGLPAVKTRHSENQPQRTEPCPAGEKFRQRGVGMWMPIFR